MKHQFLHVRATVSRCLSHAPTLRSWTRSRHHLRCNGLLWLLRNPWFPLPLLQRLPWSTVESCARRTPTLGEGAAPSSTSRMAASPPCRASRRGQHLLFPIAAVDHPLSSPPPCATATARAALSRRRSPSDPAHPRAMLARARPGAVSAEVGCPAAEDPAQTLSKFPTQTIRAPGSCPTTHEPSTMSRCSRTEKR